MPEFLEQLRDHGPLVADGATGTNLQQVGLPAGAHTEDWVIDQPQKIVDLEVAFVEAGAEIILTCTFGASRPRMQGSRYADRVLEINERAAALARRAALDSKHVLVAGSMGPIGQLLEPFGTLTLSEARAAYAEQAGALSRGGVDLLVIETQFSLEEARAAFEGVRSATDLPVIVSFSYDRGTRTMMGVRPTDAANLCRELETTLIGANCGTTLQNMRAILQDYAATAPANGFWAKPNAGVPHLDGITTVYDVTPEAMSDFAEDAVRLGAKVVGGCCGTTPAHVRAMAKAVKIEVGGASPRR